MDILWDIIWLLVLTILKNMKVNGKDYPIYYRTNGYCIAIVCLLLV